ncbi:MAG TPA: S8 family serine peptidase [Anaerolineae bacterium]|nr:S8 family serine peptidase [Anaerolineae bacterium]
MPKRSPVFVALLTLCLLGIVPTSAEEPNILPRSDQPSAVAYVPGEVLVQWRQGVASAVALSAIAREGLTVLEEFASLRSARLAVPEGEEWSYVDKLGGHPLVDFAEPNYLAQATGDGSLYPDDPDWLKQWNMRRIAAPEAWPLSTGAAEVVVAVVDSGVDADHPDLTENLLPGYDFVNHDADPDDDFGHGTHVTGILSARLNNTLGVAGLAPDISILPLKVLNDRGSGTYANISAAIQHAADSGASIISLSLGGESASAVLLQAVTNAHAAGVLLVASAGNQGRSGVYYPARYPEVMAIAATDHYDRWAPYSNWGAEVDLAAPGGTAADPIRSTAPGGYQWEYGTSMAAPHVAGAAALMRAENPALSPDEIADILRQTADKVGQHLYSGGRNVYLGFGRLNSHEALRHALPPSLTVEPEQLVFLGDQQHAPTARRLLLSNESTSALQWRAEKASGGSWLNLIPPLAGSISHEVAGKLNGLASTGGLSYGVHEGSVRFSSTTAGAQGLPFNTPVILSLVPELSFVHLPALENSYTGFDWLDASTGTRLDLTDEMSATVALPWSFPFYENAYTQVWVGDNGLVSFGQGYAGRAPDGTYVFNNRCLPSANQPNNVLYPFWDDLDPSQGGAIYTKRVGEDTFVIEWLQVVHWDGADPETFQVVLRRDGRITFQYLTISDDESVTVGAENYDGTMSWQWLCNTAGTRLRSNTALPLDLPDL